MKVLDDRHVGVPVPADLLEVIRDAPDSVRQVALDRGNLDRYRDLTEHLEASLIGLINGGRLGQIFASHTTAPMQLDRPVVFDLSSISDADTDLQAAVGRRVVALSRSIICGRRRAVRHRSDDRAASGGSG